MEVLQAIRKVGKWICAGLMVLFGLSAISIQSTVYLVFGSSRICHVGSIPELEDLVLKASITKVLEEPLEFAEDILPVGLPQGDDDDPEVMAI